MKATRRLLAASAAACLLAAACGGEDDDDGEALEELGEGEGEVSIIAWAGYIERGETDAAYDWVSQFEQDTGCAVSVKTAATSDEMVTLMTGSEGEYDLVTASGDASLRLIRGETVQPVNIELIPSYDTVDERLQEAAWHTVDGEHYGTPYLWGSNVLMYNTEVFAEAPTSWNVVFEEQTLPDGESNAGRVQAYDGPIHIADAAQYLKAHNPDLGIDDPYALNQEQFDASIELLRQQNALVNKYWHDVYAQMEDFTSGTTVASGSWPFQVNLLAADGQPIASVVPEEGATGWADTTMLHADAPHPNCAYRWMEWSLNPKVQGDASAWFGAVPSVPAACEGNELLGAEGCATNGFDNFERIAFWKTPESDCFGDEDEGTCVPYSEWVESYQEILNM
ncbi:MAG TPA: ABC transporter substrate-binding protein [Ilumatobacter sp.]|jgi:putative spermidine/putrescine transport system substrate-binding protein|nr:ABC transporter substrate-binding protein [Ilumatobacter sp.]